MGESGLNHYRENGELKVNSIGATGIAQFLPSTFEANKKYMGQPEYKIENWEDQLNVMGYMWSKNQQCQWEVFGRVFGGCGY